jgi:nifR3 family TIM-barrel protein
VRNLKVDSALYHPVQIGALTLPGNLFLAPVAGYTDRAFRSLCAEEGSSFSFTELVSAEALSRQSARYGLDSPCALVPASANLIRRGEGEKRYAVQLFGADSASIYKAAALLAPLHPDALDINAGCPVPKVVKSGAGSALMKNPAALGKVIEAAVRASRECLGGVPVTVKLRSGWDGSSLNYGECAHVAVEAGAAMVSLHPRTRSQNYGGRSDWSRIAELAARLPVPVTGSGDLYAPEDALRMLKETGCAAVMFARGAIGNPFIFSATRSFLETGAWEPVPPSAKTAAFLRHLESLACDIGEQAACLEMRKQFCAYTKGFHGGGALRDKAVHASTIAEYRDVIKIFTTNHTNQHERKMEESGA